MIDLPALKEQLKLLGHKLPDEQVVAILRDMNIDFKAYPSSSEAKQQNDSEEDSESVEDSPGPAAVGPREDKPLLGPQRTGSILDSFQKRQEQRQPVPTAVPYGYTDQTRATGLRPARIGMPPAPSSSLSYARMPATASGDSDDATDIVSGNGSDVDVDDDESELDDQRVSCRHCSPGCHSKFSAERGPGPACFSAGGLMSRTLAAWAEPVAASNMGTGQAAVSGTRSTLERKQHSLENPAESLGRLSLGASSQGLGPAGARPSLPATAKLGAFSNPLLAGTSPPVVQPRPGNTNGAGSLARGMPVARHGAFSGQPSQLEDNEDDESDILASSDKGSPGPVASAHGMARRPGTEREGPSARSNAAAGARPGVAGTAAHGLYYGAWLDEHHNRQQHLEAGGPDVDAGLPTRSPLSPQASNRSFVSRASTTRGSKGTVRKVDRVQRYQQLQQEWSQNRFLKQAGGGSRSTARKPVNFHSHFAQLHAAEEAERQRMLRDTRAKTKKVLSAATDAPTANRRDELRWQTRMRLKAQE